MENNFNFFHPLFMQWTSPFLNLELSIFKCRDIMIKEQKLKFKKQKKSESYKVYVQNRTRPIKVYPDGET